MFTFLWTVSECLYRHHLRKAKCSFKITEEFQLQFIYRHACGNLSIWQSIMILSIISITSRESRVSLAVRLHSFLDYCIYEYVVHQYLYMSLPQPFQTTSPSLLFVSMTCCVYNTFITAYISQQCLYPFTWLPAPRDHKLLKSRSHVLLIPYPPELSVVPGTK